MKKSTHIIFLSAAVATGLLQGCGDEGASDGSAGNQTNPQEATVQSQDLQGVWRSNCFDPDEIGLGEVSELTFAADSFTRLSRIGASGGCEDAFVEISLGGKFSSGGVVTAGPASLDFLTSVAVIKPTSKLGAKVLNLAATCGVSDWRLDEARDVHAQLGEPGCLANYPKRNFTVFLVDGMRAFFGLDSGAAVLELRPVELDQSIIYLKQ